MKAIDTQQTKKVFGGIGGGTGGVDLPPRRSAINTDSTTAIKDPKKTP